MWRKTELGKSGLKRRILDQAGSMRESLRLQTPDSEV